MYLEWISCPNRHLFQAGCVNVTLNNALNLGNCLGSSLDFCTGTSGTSGLTQGVTKLLSCLLTGLYTYGSPQGIFNALGALLVVIVNRLAIPSINLPLLGSLQLCPSNPCLNFFIKNDTCNGPISVILTPVGNLSSCVGDLAMLCTAGSPTTTNEVNSLVNTIAVSITTVSSILVLLWRIGQGHLVKAKLAKHL